MRRYVLYVRVYNSLEQSPSWEVHSFLLEIPCILSNMNVITSGQPPLVHIMRQINLVYSPHCIYCSCILILSCSTRRSLENVFLLTFPHQNSVHISFPHTFHIHKYVHTYIHTQCMHENMYTYTHRYLGIHKHNYMWQG